MKKIVDLSHTIREGIITYKGLPAPIVCDYLSREASRNHYEGGAEFQIDEIKMVGNTGTYLDSPFHRYEDGDDVSQLPLSQLAELEGIVIRADHLKELGVGLKAFPPASLAGKAVLIHTGWDRHWDTDAYFENHPFLTEKAAAWLVEAKPALVGIDSHNIDDTRSRARPIHSALLGAGILIVEHLCQLGELPDDSFSFSAVPPKFEGVGTFPVRAFASW